MTCYSMLKGYQMAKTNIKTNFRLLGSKLTILIINPKYMLLLLLVAINRFEIKLEVTKLSLVYRFVMLSFKFMIVVLMRLYTAHPKTHSVGHVFEVYCTLQIKYV